MINEEGPSFREIELKLFNNIGHSLSLKWSPALHINSRDLVKYSHEMFTNINVSICELSREKSIKGFFLAAADFCEYGNGNTMLRYLQLDKIR